MADTIDLGLKVIDSAELRKLEDTTVAVADIGKKVQDVAKKSKKLGTQLSQEYKAFHKASLDEIKDWKKISKLSTKVFKDSAVDTKHQTKSIRHLGDEIAVLTDKTRILGDIQKRMGAEDISTTQKRLQAYGKWGAEINKAMGEARAAGKDEAEALEKIQKNLEATTKTAKESLNLLKEEAFGKDSVAAVEAIETIKTEAEKARADLKKSFLEYGGKKAGADIAEGIKDGIGAIGAKDVQGFAKGILKGLGAGGKGLGAHMQRWGAKKAADPDAGGKMKMLAGMTGKMGGAIGAIAKMGPALMATVGVVAAIVKTIMDADSAAKEFNKDLLSTGSTSEFLAGAGRDANAGFLELQDTVRSIQTAAFDFGENKAWGINKKTHSEYLGALQAEGVSLKHIDTDAKTAGKSAGNFSAEMVHVGVAYSRNFGVSLSEIGALQGEMFREMGASAGSVRDQFAMMGQAASDSGIAANKFFGIVRGMSADMSLFNLRMEDVVGTMKLLSKSMNTKNAESFMKTLTGFYKEMDLSGRIKATILRGEGATKGSLQKDSDVNIKAISSQVADKLGGGDKMANEVTEAIKGSPKQLSDFIAKNQVKLAQEGNRGLVDAMYDAQNMQGKLTHGGLIDIASALKDASPITVMEQINGIAMKMTGKKLDALHNVDLLAATNLIGMSDQQLDQAKKAQRGIDSVKTNLVATLKDSSIEQSQEQKDMLKKMGVTGKTQADIAKVEGMSNRDIWTSMTDAEKKNFKPAKTAAEQAEEFAKKQESLTQSLADKLDILADYLLNLVYRGLMLILDVMPGADDERVQARMQMDVMKSGNKQLRDALDQSGGNVGKFKGSAIMDTDIGKRTASILMNTGTEIEKLRNKQSDLIKVSEDGSKSNEERAAAEKERAQLDKDIDAKQEAYAGLVGAVQKDIGKYSASDQADKLFEAMGQAGVSGTKDRPGRLGDAMGAVKSGASWQDALEKSGFNAYEIGKIMGKALWALSPEQIASVLGEQAKGVPTEAASPQAQASATLDAPGTGGAAATAPAVVSASPTAPGTGSGGGKPAAVVVPDAQKQNKNIEQALVGVDGSVLDMEDTIYKTLTGKDPHGVRLGKPLPGWSEDGIEKPVLKAMQQALFEFFLYSGDEAKVKDVLEAMGKDSKDITKGSDAVAWEMKQLKEGQTPKAIGAGADPHADGGYVTDTSGPLAKIIRPAPGEAFASIGRGESILPSGGGKGGGGGGGSVKVELSFKDGMERFVEAKVLDTTYEDRRRRKFN